MNGNKTPNINIGDELDYGIWLKEKLQVLIDSKKIIILITTLCFAIGIILGFFVLKPTYQSQSRYLISFPEKLETPYGLFYFPSRNISDYWEINNGSVALGMTTKELGGKYTINQLKEMINLAFRSGTSELLITVTAQSPEEAYRIAKIHEQSYLVSLNMMFKQIIVENFNEVRKSEISALEKLLTNSKKELASAKTLLHSIPKLIPIENSLIDENSVKFYLPEMNSKELQSLKKGVILSEVVNPDYNALSNLIGILEMDVNSTSVKLETYREDITALSKKINELQIEKENNNQQYFNEDGLNFKSSIITVINHPEINTNKVSPNIKFILAISIILGLIISTITSFIIKYWSKL